MCGLMRNYLKAKEQLEAAHIKENQRAFVEAERVLVDAITEQILQRIKRL